MRTVTRPAFDAEETYRCCISRVQDNDLKSRLEDITEHIAEAAKQYSIRARNLELHLVPQENDVAGMVTKDEMVKVYSGRMAHKGSSGRRVYDALKLLPDYGICPFCNHGPVSTLEHILPKSLFPALVVTPDNLVGACRECNSLKQAIAPTWGHDVPLHPYFDDISEHRWLGARVIHGKVASLVFHVIPVDEWSEELNARIRNQFKILKLGLVYASQAAREISGQRTNMIRIFDARGEVGVREELREKSSAWEEHDSNCWQAVTFRALSESVWYCSSGFQGS